MTTRQITGISLGVVTAAFIAWDFWLAGNRHEGDTITEIIRDTSYRHPLLPFGVGVVTGHFLWGKKPRENP